MADINSSPDTAKAIKVLHADLDYAAMELGLEVVLAEVERWRQAYLIPDVNTQTDKLQAKLDNAGKYGKEGQR